MHHAYSFSGWQQMAPCSPSYVTVAEPALCGMIIRPSFICYALSGIESSSFQLYHRRSACHFQYLATSANLLWLAEAATGIGSIAGSIALRSFKAVDMSGAWRFLERQSVSAPDGTGFIPAHPGIYRICLHLCIQHLHHAVAALFNIYAQTFLQKSTPNHLLGKVASMVTMVVMCSYPIGQSLYGILLRPLRQEWIF